MLTEATPARTGTRGTPRAVPRLLLCGGLLVLVAGTFLPWLYSGQVAFNSYATGGAARRLLEVGGVADSALRAWPFIGLPCAAAIALVLLDRHLWGATLATLAALAAGSVAAWALAAPSHGLLRAATAGPAVTLAGAIMTLAGVLACASMSGRTFGRVPGRGSA